MNKKNPKKPQKTPTNLFYHMLRMKLQKFGPITCFLRSSDCK